MQHLTTREERACLPAVIHSQICCCYSQSDLLLLFTVRSAAVIHSEIFCCYSQRDLLLLFTVRSAAVIHSEICCCFLQ